MVLWCSERTASIAAIEISETSLAAGIKDSGLGQGRAGVKGNAGEIPEGAICTLADGWWRMSLWVKM